MFLCPECRTATLLPVCRHCGFKIPVIDGILQLTDNPNLNLDAGNGDRYIGYDEIGENFDPGALYCDGWLTQDDLYRSCSRKLVELFGQKAVVLDLGAGLGAASIPLAEAGARVIAADISQNMLRILKSRTKPEYPGALTCCRMNAYRLMLPDHSVDAVVENRMLHLVENPRDVVAEIARVLKPGGALVRYSPSYLQGEPERYEVNNLYFLMSKDIFIYYFTLLKKYGYEYIYFDKDSNAAVLEYFEKPKKISTGLEREFTQKMKFRIHRLRTKAHSGLQHVPDDIHRLVWEETEKYAISKYGENYEDIPSYSKYSSTLDVYRLRADILERL